MPQNIRIALVATDNTQQAKKGVDDLEKRIEAIEKAWKEAGNASDTAGKKMQSASNQSQKAANGLNSSIKTIGASIAAFIAVDQIINLGKRIIEVTSEFQKFEAVLTNTLGSNVAAQAAMQKVADVAAKTNFSVKELTDSYIKFANRGIKLTSSELTKLADIANSTGKSFDQLTEAALDAFSGENERLKEFGITAKKTGDTTQYTFKGITTEVKNTQAAVKDYLLSLGELEGVAGSTAAISKTLGGQISNFGDALDQLFVTIGQGVSGPFSGLISSLTEYVNWVKNALMTTEQFNNALSNKRASEFVDRFAKQTEEVQKAQVQRIRQYIDAQAELLAQEIALRQERQQAANEQAKESSKAARALITAPIIEKSAREKELEVNLDTNKKKLDLIVTYYSDKAKEVAKGEQGLSDKEKKEAAKRLKAEMEALERRRKAGRALNDELQKQAEELSLSALQSKEDAEKADADREKNRLERMKKENKDIQDAAKNRNDELEKQEKEHQERIQALREATFAVSAEFVNALFQIGRDRNQQALDDLNTKKDAELKRVGDDKQAQAFINAKFDREEAKIKTKQAIADKAAALFNVAIQTAQAVVTAIAKSPETFGLPFSAFALASGAIQAAVIAARPIPKYAKGTEYLNGKSGTDTNLIYADTGERIVPKAVNREMMGIQNSELPRLAAMYRAEPMARAELRELIRAANATTSAVKQIRVERTHITERGIQKVVEQGNNRTKILNDQFSL